MRSLHPHAPDRRLRRRAADTRTAALTEIGQALREAVERATARPGSSDHEVALERSVEAMDQLLEVGWPGHVAELMRIAGERVRRGEPRSDDARPPRRKTEMVRR